MRDPEGNLTGHLVGLFNRTIQFMENGVKPIWVFDGKPPEMKSKELDKRKEQKEFAEEERKKAEEAGDLERAKQMAGRSIKITDEMMADAKKLIKLMGVPLIEAPSEAEAQACEIVKMGLAFGVASEDMDCLTFGTDFLLRGFNSKKEPICQIELKQVLEGFEMNQEEFIDLCILCGCDYTHTIGGMGPVTAYKLVKECGDIEKVLNKVAEMNLDETRKKKYVVPENFNYEQARKLFIEPDVVRDKQEIEKMIKFEKPYEEELKQWLIESKGFGETKVTNGLERLKKSATKKNQTVLGNFFKSSGVLSSTKKVEAPVKGAAAKKTGAKKLRKSAT